MGHWEELFDSQFLRWFDLQGKPALVEIVKVYRKELVTDGGVKNKRPILEYKQVQGSIEEIKPLVLNKTNGRSIAIAHGGDFDEWPGKQVVFYQTQTQLRGETVNCIRIRAKKG